jgi:hypothetical protein
MKCLDRLLKGILATFWKLVYGKGCFLEQPFLPDAPKTLAEVEKAVF